MTLDELVTLLGSNDLPRRMEAFAWAQQKGIDAAHDLVAALRHPDANLIARVWTMMALSTLWGTAAAGLAHDALIERLSDPSPTVRRQAIKALQALDDVGARDAIARLLTDDAHDRSAWFDDDLTVALTARVAIDFLDRPR
jgi:HEAT repeat protein